MLFKCVLHNIIFLLTILCCAGLTACGSESRTVSSSDLVSPEIIEPSVPDIIDPVLHIPQFDAKKTQLQVGQSFSYLFTLGSQQSIRFIAEDHSGSISFSNNQLNYNAPALITTDILRFELSEVNNDQSIIRTIISWHISIIDGESRFEKLASEHDKALGTCIKDNETHKGITWLVPPANHNQSYSWGNWQAILPGFSAQCDQISADCTTENLIAAINQQQLCGHDDWRLPEAYEMQNLIDIQFLSLADNQAAIDPFYFPGVGFLDYWLAQDSSELGLDNQAYSANFSQKFISMNRINKRLPQAVMLVAGSIRDEINPVEVIEPLAEKDSFIRLNNQGQPLEKAHQQAEYDVTPWQCLDDLRPLVRDNVYLRDGKFATSYWLLPTAVAEASAGVLNSAEITLKKVEFSQLNKYIAQLNQQNYCQQQDWRLPTRQEMSWLLHRDLASNTYQAPYEKSLNYPQQGGYWLAENSEGNIAAGRQYFVQQFPRAEELSQNVFDQASNSQDPQAAYVLLIAQQHEYRPEEDSRSKNNHAQPSRYWLRNAYQRDPSLWPAPFLDDSVIDGYRELAPLASIEELLANNSALDYAADEVALGEDLFFDPKLSQDNDISCASCHQPQQAWSDGLETSVGHAGQHGKRNAPSIANSIFLPSAFWDGRAETLEQQALMPIQDPIEMAQDLDALLIELNSDEDYRKKFFDVYQKSPINSEQLAKALASFQRTIISKANKLDQFITQVAEQGASDILNDQELWGLDIFRRNGRCVNCHMGAEMSNHKFENIGLTYYKRFYQDLGRYNISDDNRDTGKFKTPGLRDVMNTGPWFHNGLVDTIEGLISMYSEGMATNDAFGWEKYDDKFPQLSKKIRPLNFTLAEAQALQAFLLAITAEPRLSPARPSLE